MHKIRNEKVMAMFGQNVRRIRIEKNLTQEQLAEGASISQVQIARIEAGKINTSISTVVAVAKALGVGEGELFG
jgi:transcriptional regulator with XRE-family HTH domain